MINLTEERNIKLLGVTCRLEPDLDQGIVKVFSPYNPTLLENIKSRLRGRKWNKPGKYWYCPINHANSFQLGFLAHGAKVYNHFKAPPEEREAAIRKYCEGRFPADRQPYRHQIEMAAHAWNARGSIIAGDMGTGKTLASIITLELLFCSGLEETEFEPNPTIYWLSAKTPVKAAKADFEKWGAKITPYFMTYQTFANKMKGNLLPTPRVLICDESSMLKTPGADRTMAVQNMRNRMFNEFGLECWTWLLSGTPAPMRPTDWYSQCEIAWPGFVKEGTSFLFRERLAHVQDFELPEQSRSYKEVFTYKDSEEKCADCGRLREDVAHTKHKFKEGKNEVERFGKSAAGFVRRWRKQDCLDLPEKTYELIRLQPEPEVLAMAQAVVNSASRGADAYIMLRTISDGFRYVDVDRGGRTICPNCEDGMVTVYDFDPTTKKTEESRKECSYCNGTGETIDYERDVVPMASPKLDALSDIMDECDETGRINIFAGFHGSLDRVRDHVLQKGWQAFMVDGRGGWRWYTKDGQVQMEDTAMLRTYQKEFEVYPEKVAFIGHPKAAGYALTLTAAEVSVFYSNDLQRETRAQAEDRGHRIGMSKRGGRIVDLVHLDTDLRVLEAIKESRRLQEVSLKAVKDEVDAMLRRTDKD